MSKTKEEVLEPPPAAAAPAAADFETGSTAYRTGDFTAAIDEDAEFAEKNLARLANLMSAKQITEGE